MVAGVFELCGAWLGHTISGGGRENPKGFFENVYLREKVVKHILSACGVDPLGVHSLPRLNQLPNVNGLKQTIADYLQHEQYEGKQPWLFKDAKLSLLWPIFLQTFPQAKWVIVRRDRDEIIRSCLRTPFMNQHSKDIVYWQKWAQAYEARLEALKKSTQNWREINSAELVSGRLDTAMEIAIWCRLNWQEEQVQQFIVPQYWHSTNVCH